MSAGARITDQIDQHNRTGDYRGAVRALRVRAPERLRWRVAVSQVTQVAGALRGVSRMRIEEPTREIVLDLDDRVLRRETVLDARRAGVDLDRGEVLPIRTRWDLKRTAYLVGVDHEQLSRYTALPADFEAPIDTAATVILSRALATSHKVRADKLMARIDDGQRGLQTHERYMAERAEYDRDLARRWAALARTLVEGSV